MSGSRAPAGRASLSACIITRDEAARLPECLRSVEGLASEIVVVDSGSTDATPAIAAAAGARVITRPFDGFGTQKQAALELCTGDWVLSLDADERVTPVLAASIHAILHGGSEADGLAVRRELWYLGHRLRFGGTSDWVMRLARRTRCRFSPDPIHERLLVDGPTGRLRGSLVHRKYERLAEHVGAMNRYTDVVARKKRQRGRRFHAWHLARIPYELLARLVGRGGVLDGRAGVIYAAMAAYSGFLKYAKLWPDQPPAEINSPVGGNT